MAAYYKEQGKTLWQVWDELENAYGIYTEKLCSFAFPGADGLCQMYGLMNHLRNEPPKQIAALPIRQVTDYKEVEKTGLPASDVLAFHLEDGGRVIIRPSGTEPKMKVYLSVKTAAKPEGEQRITELECEMRNLILLS